MQVRWSRPLRVAGANSPGFDWVPTARTHQVQRFTARRSCCDPAASG